MISGIGINLAPKIVQSEQSQGKYTKWGPFSISVAKIYTIALGAMAIYAMEAMPRVEAGFGFFTVCMAACTAGTGGFGVMACAAACSATLAPVVP